MTQRIGLVLDCADPEGLAAFWAPALGYRRVAAAGAYVVLVDGAAVLYLERGGRSLVTLPAAADGERRERAVAGLAGMVAPAGPFRELRIERVDRGPVVESPLAEPLRDAGFRPSYRGYALRRS